MLVTSQKEGAITGGPAFVQAVGDTILDATVSENLPGMHTCLLCFLENCNHVSNSSTRLTGVFDSLRLYTHA